jgi:membrane-bound inhibitor of C-type lysozyme
MIRSLSVLLLAAASPAAAQWQSLEVKPVIYHCPDGTRVEASYVAPDRIYVTYMSRTMLMQPGPAADGVRYVGGGWQWWTRGRRDGTIAPVKPSESVASAPGQTCSWRGKFPDEKK